MRVNLANLLRQAAACIEHSTPDRNAVLEEAARDYAAENDDDQWCQRVKYGQCALRKCNVEGGWTPGEPADYSRATCARYRLECALTTTPEPTDPAGVSELDRLQEQCLTFKRYWTQERERGERLENENRALQDRLLRTPPMLEVAKEALEPFALAGAELADESPTDMAVVYSINGQHVRLTHLRQAYAALQTIGAGQ